MFTEYVVNAEKKLRLQHLLDSIDHYNFVANVAAPNEYGIVMAIGAATPENCACFVLFWLAAQSEIN